jgi:hypothetical protein
LSYCNSRIFKIIFGACSADSKAEKQLLHQQIMALQQSADRLLHQGWKRFEVFSQIDDQDP